MPRGGDFIQRHFVPGGTKIAACAWGIQRNKIYGDDVEVFRPERWLDAHAEKVQEMQKVLDLIFGYGRWGCLGKSIAYIELNKIFVEVKTDSTRCGCTEHVGLMRYVAPTTF